MQHWSASTALRATILQTVLLRLRPILGLPASTRLLLPPTSAPVLLLIFLLCLRSASSPISFTDLCFWAHHLHSSTAAPSSSLGRLLTPLNSEHPDASRSVSARHFCVNVSASAGTIAVFGTVGLLAILHVCRFFPENRTATSSLFDCNPSHHYRSYVCATRWQPGNSEAVRRAGLLHRSGLGRATEVQYRESCRTHVSNCRRETFSSHNPAQTQARPSCVSSQCLSGSRHSVSDEKPLTPPGLPYRGESFCVDSGGGGPMSL